MKKTLKIIAKLFVFGLIFLALFVFANIFFRPVWLSEDAIGDGEGSPLSIEEVGEVAAYESTNEDATRGFYEEPKNRIETLFVGASMTSVGITPMELYENYGICAYSITSEAQPVLASYYWVKEAYRLHPDTLKTVVFDVSMMRRDVGKGFYEKALNGMKYSSVKREAINEASNGMGAVLGYTFPLLTYHSRWAELGRTDFHKLNYEPRSYLRGYNLRTKRIFNEGTYEDMPLSTSVVNTNVEARIDVHEKSEKYFKKLVKFCNDNGIKLIMYKTPSVGNWGNKEHFSIQALADSEGVEFLDFVFEPLIDDIGYNPATDAENKKHNNYYGAKKLTDWFGKYLTTECGATDVRGNADYAYMDSQLAEYQEKIETVIRLKETTSIGDYMKVLAEGGRFTALISVRGSAGRRLDKDNRKVLDSLGLKELAKMDDDTAYLGVLERGTVKYERAVYDAQSDGNAIGYTGRFPKGIQYTINSGSTGSGDISNILIDGEEYSWNNRGINIVVYDNDAETIVDDTYFDTWESSDRESFDTESALAKAMEDGKEYEALSPELKKLYLYNERVKYYREATHLKIDIENEVKAEKDAEETDVAEGALSTAQRNAKKYADYYKGRENIVVFVSVKANDSLPPGASVIEADGMKVSEPEGSEKSIRIQDIGYDIISDNGLSQIIINQKDYSPNEDGINVVVYDKKLQMVVDTAVF
ncbi:MAG: hypothetical protein IKH94_02565 [Eubacterium sp.]|nr:hypothetical protein [Eubacterium sp.]